MQDGHQGELSRQSDLSRRTVLKSLAALGATASPLFSGDAMGKDQPDRTVRERLWLWSHVAGSYDGQYNLPGKSHITPAEASALMGIPNVFMIHRDGLPKPPLQEYARDFHSLREVVWGIVGAGGRTNAAERDAVLELAFQNPRITGVVMDDFFKIAAKSKEGPVASLALPELLDLKRRLARPEKTLDLHVVIYEHQLENVVAEHLRPCDVVQFWTWRGENLTQLGENLEKAQKLAPHAQMMLGLYWWDFGNKKPLPIPVVQRQCELGLQWLREGRIEGVIFCGSWLCDRELEAVQWARKWIQRVGDETCR